MVHYEYMNYEKAWKELYMSVQQDGKECTAKMADLDDAEQVKARQIEATAYARVIMKMNEIEKTKDKKVPEVSFYERLNAR